MKHFFLIVFILCSTCFLFGKGGDEHSGDIIRVLGLDLKMEPQKVLAEKITNALEETIDGGIGKPNNDVSKLLREIQNVVPTFKTSPYGHRLFFHWGFNGDPKKSEAIIRCLERCNATSAEESKVWDLILAEQIKRNRKLLDSVQHALTEKTGLVRPISHDQLNAIVSIGYDVHLLGDFIEGVPDTQSALLPLDSIVADLVSASQKIKGKDDKVRNSIKKGLNDAKKAGSSAQQAEKMLEVLEKNMPKLLKSSSTVRAALY